MTSWHRMARPAATVILIAAMAAGLQGCVAVVIGGAVVGSLAATDRRTLGAQTADKEIALKANAKLSSIVGDTGHVDVTSYDRKVLLTGEVKDEAMKDAVDREIKQIPDVQNVVNEVQVAWTADLGSRSSDALITAKIGAAYLQSKDLNANSIKVVTERGVVYLMGRVTEREGKIAADLASGVSGVTKVIKIFEYISEDELKAMNAFQGVRN